jgi:ribose 5-phosphate isomerase B
MKIALGCDHRGYAVKRALLLQLRSPGYQIKDFGCHTSSGVDYADIAYPLALAVAAGQCELGILIGCNGMGMNMVANKVPGVRAATADDEFAASSAREKYHCNIICIGADIVGGNEIRKIVEVFLLATVSPRHARQVSKMREIEEMVAQAYVAKHNQPFVSVA